MYEHHIPVYSINKAFIDYNDLISSNDYDNLYYDYNDSCF